MDAEVLGARTRHNVDVLVASSHAGFAVTWIVECKLWKTPVPKEKVFALRMIVDDVGADRGILMAEGGFQSGALEAATNANVMLTSLADLKQTLAPELGLAMLHSLRDRAASCRDRYWEIDKSDRIEFELRPDVLADGFNGDNVVKAADAAADQALRYGFPMRYDHELFALAAYGNRRTTGIDGSWGVVVESAMELFAILDQDLSELERRLSKAEAALAQRER